MTIPETLLEQVDEWFKGTVRKYNPNWRKVHLERFVLGDKDILAAPLSSIGEQAIFPPWRAVKNNPALKFNYVLDFPPHLIAARDMSLV